MYSILVAPSFLKGPAHSKNENFRVSDPHFFADSDPDPGKNLHADPDPGGIRGRGLGVKGKNEFFFEFFSRFR